MGAFVGGCCSSRTDVTRDTDLEVAGAILHVEVAGRVDSPAILMWNGAGCTVRMWDRVVPRLAESFRVVRFDVRGTGQSQPSDAADQYSFERYARDAVAILEALGIERTHVWAMAWGSRAGLAFAALHPERVELLALYDASIGRADIEAQRRGREEAIAAQQRRGLSLVERPAGWNVHRDRESIRMALAAAGRFDLPAAAAKLEMPVLVATGDHDPNLASSRDLVSRAPDAELVVMETVGHGSVLQRPDLATDIFLDFVRRRSAESP